MKIFYQSHISDHQINSAKIFSSRRKKININFAVSAFEVVQNVNSNRSNVSIHFFLYLNIVSCNLFMSFSKLIEYSLTSLTVSFATWWSLISSINWFIVSSDHFRFINFMLFLIRFWRFFALIIKIFKFCHVPFW